MLPEKDGVSPAKTGTSGECAEVTGSKPDQGVQDAMALSTPTTPVMQADAEQARPYSVFTGLQKRAIILSASFMGLLSFMGSSIYFPAVNQVCIARSVSVRL